MDIKETKELLKAVGIAAKAVAKVAKDKKVDANDIPVLIEVSSEFKTLVEGFSGADKVVEELKDLDKAELIEIIQSIYTIADEVKAELK